MKNSKKYEVSFFITLVYTDIVEAESEEEAYEKVEADLLKIQDYNVLDSIDLTGEVFEL